MGQDKALLPAPRGTLLSHIVWRLAPTVNEIVVAGAHAIDPTLPARWVADRQPGAGPLSGMAAGLAAARHPYAWVVACDLPEVDPGLANVLFAAARGYEAAVPRPDREAQGVCAVYATTLVPRIEELLRSGERSVLSLLERSRVQYLDSTALRRVDPELRSFRNLNTPEDYERWLNSLPAAGKRAARPPRSGRGARAGRSSEPGR